MFDPNLHLFVDDWEIHQIINLQRVVNRPEMWPEPVVVADQPWESGCEIAAWGSIIREESGLFRLWYELIDPSAHDRCYCYAESEDGIDWVKPVLDLVEWRGNKENNVFHRFETDTPPGVVSSFDGITVLRDDYDPDPEKRYKLFGYAYDPRQWAREHPDRFDYRVPDQEIEIARKAAGLYMLTSMDGMHWTRQVEFIKPALVDYLMVLRDHRNERWMMNERAPFYSDPAAGHHRRRAIGFSTSEDLYHWNPTEAIVLNTADSDFGRLWEWHGMTPFNYGNMDLGFLETQTSVYWLNALELVSHRDGGPGNGFRRGAASWSLALRDPTAAVEGIPRTTIQFASATNCTSTTAVRAIPRATGMARRGPG